MKLDRKFLLCGFAYAVFGMCVGLYMAGSKNHGEYVAHAHIMLAGFVLSFLYALIHKLWTAAGDRPIAAAQFYVHQVSALVLGIGLLVYYAGLYQEIVDPILAVASTGVLVGVLMMAYLVAKFPLERA